MDILQNRHFTNYKFIFTCYGQWPYQPRFQKNCLRFLITMSVLSILTPKTIRFIKYFGNIDGMIQCIPMIGVHLLGLVKYYNYTFNYRSIRRLFSLIERDGEALKNEEDKQIMERWLARVRKITTAYTAAMFPILGLFLASPAIPKVLDFIKPLNETRALIYLYETEYFVDQDEYYVPILIHTYMTVPLSVGSIVFFDNMLGTFIHHACAMLEILSNYLQRIHLDSKIKRIDDPVRLDRIRKNIIRCVHMHQNSLEFTTELESSINIAWLIVLGFNLLILTVTGMTTVIKIDQPDEAIKFSAFTMGALFHLFYNSFQGQILITQSEKIFYSIYTSQWYTLPCYHQRLLSTMIVRSHSPAVITAGKLYILSMDTFSIVLKNAMSFFTLLSSVR
ncbi:odorant receptor 4-like isoform X1 [Cotesia glomerata]|uniref:odorant receptor 4-like isoform X1 n=1 Tax=Cotesia glomerata TaxID=32391 RepID=UPI001D00CB7C|nr:odorant receptor 4-like isoform X1 [Cotesia glomerata]